MEGTLNEEQIRFREQLKDIFNNETIVKQLIEEGYNSLDLVKLQLKRNKDTRLSSLKSKLEAEIDAFIIKVDHHLQDLSEKDKLVPDCETPSDLDHYIERQGQSDIITMFFESNFEVRKKARRNEHSFLYIINGRGFGKTWSGKHASNKLLQSSLSQLRFKCFIDFGNGFRYDQQIDSQCQSSTSLALRVAASLLGKPWREIFFRFQSRIQTLTFDYLMTWFANKVRKATSSDQTILFAIHLDEIQTNSIFTQSLLHEIGNFMCSGTESTAQKLNIVLFPILTGTSSSDLRPEVTGFGSRHIDLHPFTFQECIRFIDNHIPNFNADAHSPRFKRSLMAMGGIPQMVSIFKDNIKDGSIQYLEHAIQRTITAIDAQYKITRTWVNACKTRHNLSMIVALSISNYDVLSSHQLPDDNLTLEDVSRWGIIFLEPNANYTFNIVYPLIVLELLNRLLNFTSIDLMEPLNLDWGWKKFELFEAEFERLKNNSHVLAGWTEADIESYYSKCSPRFDLRNRKFKFTSLDDTIGEDKQFLKKDVLAQPLDNIEQDQLFNHSFICKAGTPCVDTRVFRKPLELDPIQKPWMFCKQLKHTQNNDDNVTSLSAEVLSSIYQEFKKRLGNLTEKFRIVYIIFTNKVVRQEELDQFYQVHIGAIVIHRDNIDEYLQGSFSLFSITDNDGEMETE